jgi:hypothetical protein
LKQEEECYVKEWLHGVRVANVGRNDK